MNTPGAAHPGAPAEVIYRSGSTHLASHLDAHQMLPPSLENDEARVVGLEDLVDRSFDNLALRSAPVDRSYDNLALRSAPVDSGLGNDEALVAELAEGLGAGMFKRVHWASDADLCRICVE